MIHNNFYLHELEAFDILAWDVDQTLINNPNEKIFARYILEHPDQTHVIVTHRSHGTERQIDDDLYFWHGKKSEALIESFKGILSVPDPIWDSYNLARLAKEIAVMEHDQSAIDVYFQWKGKLCLDIGAAALIDDNIEHCYPGCEIHGIHFFHSLGLI